MGHGRKLFALLGACAVAALVAPPSARAALVGQWNIDEGSGGIVGAQVGSIEGSFLEYGNVSWGVGGPPTTTLPGGAEITPSNHLNFDLIADDSFEYVDMVDPDGVLSPASLTVGFWARASDLSFDNKGKVVLSKWSDTQGFSWEFGFGNGVGTNTTNLFFRVKPETSGQLFIGATGTGFTPDANGFNDGEWHHFVGTYDGAETHLARLYVDGKIMGETIVAEPLLSGAAPMRLGQRPYSDPYRVPFKGQIGGALVVFDNALTGEQVCNLGGFEYVPPVYALVGRWDLNETALGLSTPKVVGPQDGLINGNMALASGGPPTTHLPGGTQVVNSNHFVCGGQVGDNINLGSSEELSPANITVAFWAQTTVDNTGKVLVSKHSTAGSSWEFAVGLNQNMFFRAFTAGGQAFPGSTATDPFTNADLMDGQWHLFVGTHDGTAASFYVDGELVESLSLLGPLNNTTGITDLMIGQRPYTSVEAPYTGNIGGPLLIYNYALTAEEVAALLGTTPTPLLGDANNDRIVNDKDASILGAHWQQAGDWGDGDFNLDGLVNDKDAAILAAHWGETSGTGGSVPEPGVIVLLLGGALCLCLRGRRKP
ncbi:MAG: hypothetical protein NTW96_26325 [Planctomycetia bacterium]|nr:hypothetical protein [Planctomycetia bacterium]